MANNAGQTVDLHYSASHIERIRELKRQGKRINLPPGVTLDDDPPADPPAIEGSTGSTKVSSLTSNSPTPTGTAGSSESGA